MFYTAEIALIEDDNPIFLAVETSDIVLFITQIDVVHFD